MIRLEVTLQQEKERKNTSVVKDKNHFNFGIRDDIFKSILFGTNRDMSIWFMEYITNVLIKKYEILSNELAKKRENSRTKVLDVVVILNNKYFINLEINSKYYKSLHIRNMTFSAGVYENMISTGENYSNDKVFYHFDITSGLPNGKKRPELIRYRIKGSDGYDYIQNFEIYEFNVDKIMEHWYNQDSEIDRYAPIIMLKLGKKDLSKLVSGGYLSEKNQKYIREFRKDLNEMNKKKWYRQLMSKKEDNRKIYNTLLSEARDEGIEQGIEQGIEETQIKAIKNMTSKNFTPEIISECLNIPLNRVKQILSSITL